jgi:alpha/beta superfamily hydrolase
MSLKGVFLVVEETSHEFTDKDSNASIQVVHRFSAGHIVAMFLLQAGLAARLAIQTWSATTVHRVIVVVPVPRPDRRDRRLQVDVLPGT